MLWQVRYAFLAGLAVVALLIPVNRWLAVKIERASVRMMAHKDARLQVMAELLRGIYQVKLAAWEPRFIRKVISEITWKIMLFLVLSFISVMYFYSPSLGEPGACYLLVLHAVVSVRKDLLVLKHPLLHYCQPTYRQFRLILSIPSWKTQEFLLLQCLAAYGLDSDTPMWRRAACVATCLLHVVAILSMQ